MELSIHPRRPYLALALTAAWIAAAFGGMRALNRYAVTPGEAAQIIPGAAWPKTTALSLSPERDTLLVFIHPKCACSHATLTELNRLLPEIGGKMEITLVFDWPAGRDERWEQGENLNLARALPGVKLVFDRESRELARFQVRTSGQALLFSKDGRLLFSGGLTPARGHGGDSIGRAVLIARARSGTLLAGMSSVFGCAMRDFMAGGRRERD